MEESLGTLSEKSPPLGNQKIRCFDLFEKELPQAYRTILSEFKKIPTSLVRFQFIFLFLSILETALFCASIPLLTSQIALLAIALATAFLTVFSYLLLLFYLQAKKPEQLDQILDRLISSCRSHLSAPIGTASHHLSVANSLLKLADYLDGYEKEIIRISIFGFRKFSRRLSIAASCKDVFRFKQLLFLAAIEEHLAQIRIHPTDPEVHASLATSYVKIADLYRTTSIAFPKQEEELKIQFEHALGRAQQEFKILKEFAPNDPWVHDQLANGYRELGLLDFEIKELEELKKLRPKDPSLLFRIGSVYFEMGIYGKGLQIYELLQKIDPKKAEELIRDYGKGGPTLSLVDF